MKDTYLSIDLDYWCRRSVGETTAFLQTLFALLPKGVNVQFAEHHHKLLPHVNSLPGRRIINIDFHSDLADCFNWQARTSEKPFRLNCGTWGNHVTWTEKQEFIWVYPHRCCVGGKTNRTNTSGWCHMKTNPFRPPSGMRAKRVCGWGKARLVSEDASKIIHTAVKRICGVGVCLSKSYLIRDKPETVQLYTTLATLNPKKH